MSARRTKKNPARQLIASVFGPRARGRRPGTRKAGPIARRGPAVASRLRGTVRVLVAMAVLGVINLYVLYYRRGTSVPDLIKAAEVGRQSSLLPGLDGPPGTPPRLSSARRGASTEGAQREGIHVVVGSPVPGLDLRGLLLKHGVRQQVAAEVQAALDKDRDKEAGPAQGTGLGAALYLDAEDRLTAVDVEQGGALRYRIEPVRIGATERWEAQRLDRPLKEQQVTVHGTVGKDGALADAMVRAGEARALSGLLADVFAYDLELPSAAKAGDRFTLVVEKVAAGGAFHRYGKVLAAHYEAAGAAPLRAFLFQPEGGAPGYYTPEGESLARGFLRTPLRLASAAKADGRGKSYHPAKGALPAGADLPAPAGTPVRALTEGKVSFRGARGIAGQTVVLVHGNVETSYSHLSRFARGLTEGQQVRAGQVIGYVGQSGQAGKPHLHLGLRIGGKPADPLKLRPQRQGRLAGADAAALAQVVARLQQQMKDRLARR
jgi:murein DD-endopeptidase MepM/ murein hydrolase activator NlpD